MPATSETEIVAAARSLIERCGFGAVFVPLGRDAMILVEPRSRAVFETMAQGDNYDPGGTEDTAVAAMAAGLGAGLSLTAAAHLAGLAVGIVGGKQGTAVASAGELAAALAGEARSDIGEAALRIEMPAQPRRRGQRKA
jgi:D-beta-D-heptose 7-phosphate kinase/D-beta-D-heptose 1-phosphate adenosyltransferase